MKSVFILISVALFSFTASGFEFSPMEKEFSASGSQSTQTFFLENKSANPVAVELRMYKRSHDQSGKEVRTPTEDFFIFPKSVKLNANEKRAVRVTYQGSKSVATELAYRLVAEQMNVSLSKLSTNRKGVDIRYTLTYVTSVYVTPDTGKSDVKISSVESRNGLLKVNLENTGNKHKILSGSKLLLISESGSRELSGDDIKPIHKMNLLANSTQSFVIRLPMGVKPPKSAKLL